LAPGVGGPSEPAQTVLLRAPGRGAWVPAPRCCPAGPTAVPGGCRGLLLGPLWPSPRLAQLLQAGLRPAGLPQSPDLCIRNRHLREPCVASAQRLPLAAPAWPAFSPDSDRSVNCLAKRAPCWGRGGGVRAPSPQPALSGTRVFSGAASWPAPPAGLSAPSPSPGLLPLCPASRRFPVRTGRPSFHIPSAGRSMRRQRLGPSRVHPFQNMPWTERGQPACLSDVTRKLLM